MAIENGNKVVEAKVLQVAYTTAQWAETETAAKVISKGQIVAELTTDGKTKLKMGDGVNTFANLPYITGDVEVDSTLKVAGQAADAKATGDAIANVRSSALTIEAAGAVTGTVTALLGDTATLTTTLANIDASKITTGTIDIERLPQGALERLVIVADDTARFALTTSQVQNGDVVKVTATNKMYFVKDDTQLSTEAGYEEFSAGTAGAVEWANVLNKPAMDSTLSQVGAIAEANAVGLALANKVDVVAGKQLSTEDFTTAEKTKLTNLTDNDPATALVVTGIKQSSSSVNVDKGDVVVDKSYVGLGNVTNDAQVKGLASGTTNGNIVTWGTDGYTVADSGVAAANVVLDTDTLILNCIL